MDATIDIDSPVTEFKTKTRREYATLAKAQVIGQMLHADGFGVRIRHTESVTTDAFGNEVKRNTASRTGFFLSTDAKWEDVRAAEIAFQAASDAVTIEAVKAKLAE